MADFYLAFFELGFGMLSPTGELCYITPSSSTFWGLCALLPA